MDVISKLKNIRNLFLQNSKRNNTVITGFNRYLKEHNNKAKRALVSYYVNPLLSDATQVPFSNWGIARNLASVLNELGYVVDIVNWNDTNFTPNINYDLFIGHGGINFQHIASKLNKDCIKIYFSTGSYWMFHNQQEIKRVQALNARRNAILNPDRPIEYEEESALKTSAGIIALGNNNVRKTYKQYPLVRTLNNGIYADYPEDLSKKNFRSAQNNFLFLGGSGPVHKGLDLLLEVFPKIPDKHLFVCTRPLSKEFINVYKGELFETENIHFVGFLKEKSEEIRKVMNTCAYLIHPSCSEGSPGSVILAMSYGLIPIVSLESNIDISEYGYTLYESSIEEIQSVIQRIDKNKIEDIKKTSLLIMENTCSTYSADNFHKNLKKAIQIILSRTIHHA